MQPIQIARIDSAEELVVDLDKFPRDLTVLELSQVLCVSIGAVLESLHHPKNENFAFALYEQLESTIWSNGLTTDDGTPFAIPTLADLLQGGRSDHETVHFYLSHGARFGSVDPAQWVLPRQRFVVQIGDWASPDLTPILTHYEGRQVCVNALTDDSIEGSIAQLRARVEALEAGLRTRAELQAEHGGHLGLVQNATLVVDLLRRDQKNRHGSAADRDAEEEEEFRRNFSADQASLERLRDLFTVLETELIEALSSPPEAVGPAKRLLELLNVRDRRHSDFHEVVRAVLEHPFRLSPTQNQEFFDLVERAFSALAASPLAERFFKEHVCDLLEVVCSAYSGPADEIFEDLAGTELGLVAREGWKEEFAKLRDLLRLPRAPDSLFVTLVRLGSVGKSSMSLVSAALGEATVGHLLKFLFDVSRPGVGSNGKARASAGQKLAGIILRYITFTSVQVRPKSGINVAPPNASDARKLLTFRNGTFARIRLILQKDLSARERAEALKEFRLDKQVFRTRRALGTFVALHVASLAVVLGDDDEPVPEKVMGVLFHAGGLLQTGLRANEYIFARRFFDRVERPAVHELWNLQRVAGVGVATLGAILAITRAVRGSRKADPVQEALYLADAVGATLSATGSALSALGSAFSAFRILALGSALGMIGTAVAIAVVIAALINQMFDARPGRLLEFYLDLLQGDPDLEFEKSPFTNRVGAITMRKIRKEIDEASDRALAPFKFERGTSGNLNVFKGRLTIHKAIHLGFSKHEIAYLFNSNPADIGVFFQAEDGAAEM